MKVKNKDIQGFNGCRISAVLSHISSETYCTEEGMFLHTKLRKKSYHITISVVIYDSMRL